MDRTISIAGFVDAAEERLARIDAPARRFEVMCRELHSALPPGPWRLQVSEERTEEEPYIEALPPGLMIRIRVRLPAVAP